jgi:hypothetical protein
MNRIAPAQNSEVIKLMGSYPGADRSNCGSRAALVTCMLPRGEASFRETNGV